LEPPLLFVPLLPADNISTVGNSRDAFTLAIDGKRRHIETFIAGLRPLSLLITFLYWVMSSLFRIDGTPGVIFSFGLISWSFTSDIDFHDDIFCRKVFTCLWKRREHQTCIHGREGSKYLDLRELELEFEQRTRILIRQEYDRLASEVDEVYRVYLTHKERGGVVVIGQPGIGRFAFCFRRKSFDK